MPSKKKRAQQKRKATAKGKPPANVASTIADHAKGDPGTQETNANISKPESLLRQRLRRWTRPAVIRNAFLAVITIATLFYTYRGSQSSSEQATLARQQQQPSLGIAGAQLTTFPLNENGALQMRVLVKNTGGSVAKTWLTPTSYRVLDAVSGQVVGTLAPDAQRLCGRPAEQNIGAGLTIDLAIEVESLGHYFQDWKSGKLSVEFAGVLRYSNIEGTEILPSMEFCFLALANFPYTPKLVVCGGRTTQQQTPKHENPNPSPFPGAH